MRVITFMTAVSILLGISACDMGMTNLPSVDEIKVYESTVEKIDGVDVAVPHIVILQDGVDAFTGYEIIEIPETLIGEYAKLNDGILAALNAFNLRAMANEEGVTTYAKIRTSENDETTWSFELLNLPDDSVKAENYKIYFAKSGDGFIVAQIGRRVKCYRNETPNEWTTKLCP